MKVVATIAAVAVAAIAVTAGVSGTGRVAPAAKRCMPQNTSHAPAIGRFLKVSPEAALGETSLTPNDNHPIDKDSTLCTYLPYGQIKFVVDPKVTCWMNPGSRVRVYPATKKGGTDVVVRFEAGDSTWCSTGTATKDSRFEANTGKVQLIMRDPLFGVDVDAKRRVTVKVKVGYIGVSKAGGSGAVVVVGPAQQVEVPNGGRPAEVTPLELSPDDDHRIASLSPLVPATHYSRPDASKSPALEAIFDSGLLRVAYESDADTATASFVRAFFTFLAKSWKLKLRLSGEASADIRAGVAKTWDVAAVHDPALVNELAYIPLLRNPSGVSWVELHRADPYLDAALVAFVAAYVTSGDYGDLYRVTYAGAEPDYTVLRPILVGGPGA